VHWWRHFWHRMIAPYRRGNAGRLVVLPLVLVGSVLYVSVVALYVGLSQDTPLVEQPLLLTAGMKLLLALGAPVALAVLWHRSKPAKRVLQVVDWFGAGIVALSVVWLGGLLEEFVHLEELQFWGRVLLPYGLGFWGVSGTALLVAGTLTLSGELSSEWRERRRLEALMEFTRRITSLDYQTILTEAVKHLHELLESDACVLYLWNEEEQVLIPVAGKHDPAVYTPAYIHRMMTFKCPLGFGITGWVMETGQPYISGDVMTDSHSQAVPGWSRDEKSSLLAPIQLEGRRLGVVRLTRRGLNQFTNDDLELALSFAGQAALVIEHGRTVKELSDLSITDNMTGLYNARHFHQVLAVELSRADRQQQPVALVMVDSDSLKQFNDRRGHQRGDDFLRAIGRILKENIRLSDYAFRYAGDEFLLLLPGSGAEEALVVAERTRMLIEEYDGDEWVGGTVSMGVAVYPDHATDGEAFLSMADRAMYESKRLGKNRVTTANVVLAQPDLLQGLRSSGGEL
jgi:diguanylate cyclase (GGDEF)-like protein